MVRQAHHPEQRRRVNLKFQYSMTETFEILNLSHCDLPFDLAQGGELVEPFVICYLGFVILNL
jgi:hypothetical protein